MRMTRPESSIWVQVMFMVGALVVLAIMLLIAKAVLGSS
ncbi:uncharacterized protein HemY [Nocardioides panaciterrulae]|uniref:Uncharacterized protein HemY n=1 Tax=Nocardioides panaciterrulae TaxID=661492 RepID=A0A7Y9JBJ8_9ACTN|nr:uncharacterized protein HemY [Nocardioides panaciterrulae]